MKAIAQKTNCCDGYYQGKSYNVLQLEPHALRITIKRKSKVVARRDFEIRPEPADPPELIEKL